MAIFDKFSKKIEKIDKQYIDRSIANFEKRNRCASMGWQGGLNKKKQFVRIRQVFDKLFYVTCYTQKR